MFTKFTTSFWRFGWGRPKQGTVRLDVKCTLDNSRQVQPIPQTPFSSSSPSHQFILAPNQPLSIDPNPTKTNNTTKSGLGIFARSAFCVSIGLMIFSEKFFHFSFLNVFYSIFATNYRFLELLSYQDNSDNPFVINTLSTRNVTDGAKPWRGVRKQILRESYINLLKQLLANYEDEPEDLIRAKIPIRCAWWTI